MWGVLIGAIVVAGCGRIGFDEIDTYHDVVLADHPVGYWRLGETAGPNARDETGGPPGVYGAGCGFGVPGALAGDPNSAVRFDGTTCNVDLGDRFPFEGAAPFSIEAWIAVDATSPAGTFGHVFTREDRAGCQPCEGYALVGFAPPGAYVERAQAMTEIHSALQALPFETYRYVVGVYTGSELDLFIDGVQSGAGHPDTLLLQAITTHTFIGASTDPVNFFHGVIDEVALYDKALSPAQIQAHHDAGIHSP